MQFLNIFSSIFDNGSYDENVHYVNAVNKNKRDILGDVMACLKPVKVVSLEDFTDFVKFACGKLVKKMVKKK